MPLSKDLESPTKQETKAQCFAGGFKQSARYTLFTSRSNVRALPRSAIKQWLMAEELHFSSDSSTC